MALLGAAADSRRGGGGGGGPVGSLIFHQPIELKLKACRRAAGEAAPLLWQPAGACLGLFPVSSDCFSFCQGSEPLPLREGEAKCRRHLEKRVTATGYVTQNQRSFY